MMKKKLNLSQLEVDQPARVCDLTCSGNIRRRLLDLGIIKNTLIVPVFKSISNNSTAYEVRGSVIALRKEDAKNILVETLPR